jgi:hypothetical protein
MSDEQITEQLAEALVRSGHLQFDGNSYKVVAALLPIVRRAQAQALREAADWLAGDSDGPAAPEWPTELPRADVAAMLRDRALGAACPDCGSPYHNSPCPRLARADALEAER